MRWELEQEEVRICTKPVFWEALERYKKGCVRNNCHCGAQTNVDVQLETPGTMVVEVILESKRVIHEQGCAHKYHASGVVRCQAWF